MGPTIKEIVIPQAGETMEEEVIIVKWKKSVGDHVLKGENLLDIETGKGVLELESPFEGVIKDIIIQEGQQIKPLTVVAHIECVS
jgi:pyruvate/2-oxoglutarate dehydrogenase complex dihydrolipoamide acyltransferase (E2) component